MVDEIKSRIDRIHAAIGTAVENDLSKCPPTVVRTPKFLGIEQDFRGGMNDAELENIAQALIHNIASLHDNLKLWATRNHLDPRRVDSVLKQSRALRIIRDLWNRDKHGWNESRQDWTGKSPRLGEIHRSCKLRTQATCGSNVFIALGKQGLVKGGDGDANIVITADVLDKDGDRMGDLEEIAQEAVAAWAKLLAEFGIQV